MKAQRTVAVYMTVDEARTLADFLEDLDTEGCVAATELYNTLDDFFKTEDDN
jgi:hypothetical protein